jgi:hypothetical protein
MSLPVTLTSDSLVSITFAAMGSGAPADTVTLINCDVDGTFGTSCAPDFVAIEFKYPALICCDTRSFTWVAFVSKGTHTVNISWGVKPVGGLSSTILNRTLLVQAAPI